MHHLLDHEVVQIYISNLFKSNLRVFVILSTNQIRGTKNVFPQMEFLDLFEYFDSLVLSE